ncbi:tetratricopeptide repeat protein [bacterium]|nr:tetratricopeptide repeat protein [bacterium]MBP9811258.1 tetratricopeptide repeat protein [bacterium]
MLLTFYSIVTLWANSPALAIETRFGETAELENDNLQRWWKKDHEARLLLRAGSLSQSKAAFEEAVSIAETDAAMDPGLVNSLAGLSLLEHRRGNAFESERLYELAMRYQEGFAGANSARFAAFLPDLAWLYSWHGNSKQADILFRRAIATVENQNPEDDSKVSPYLIHYKAFLGQSGRTAEAEKIAVRLKRIESKSKTVR